MTILAALAVLSLFTPFRVTMPLVHVRPFDALAFGMLAWAFSTGRVFPRQGVPLGFVALLPYFAWHVISALGVSLDNGAREGLQIVTVLAFAWATIVDLEGMEFRRLGMWLLAGMVAITVYSIGWHVANGYWSGWKRLVDPKATFTFLPLLLATLLVTGAFQRRTLVWLGWAVLGAAILMSGERKALIVFAVLSAGLMARGRVLPFVLVAGAALAGLTALSTVIDDPYLSRQLTSIVNPLETGDYSTAVSTGEAAQGDSRSNAQRGFAAALAQKLIIDNLIVGIGTNQYERVIEQQFAYLPEFLRNGIHGEFLRVLTENGLVGLLAYLAVWGLAVVRTRGVLAGAVRTHHLSPAQGALLPLITFVPCLIYVAFEGSGTHSLIVLVFASLYPDLLRAWLSPVLQVSRLPMRPGPDPSPRRGAFVAHLPSESTP